MACPVFGLCEETEITITHHISPGALSLRRTRLRARACKPFTVCCKCCFTETAGLSERGRSETRFAEFYIALIEQVVQVTRAIDRGSVFQLSCSQLHVARPKVCLPEVSVNFGQLRGDSGSFLQIRNGAFGLFKLKVNLAQQVTNTCVRSAGQCTLQQFPSLRQCMGRKIEAAQLLE